MLKNILNLNGVQRLNKFEQKIIFGGEGIQKCCVKIPGQNPPPGCNPKANCYGAPCACESNGGPKT